MKSNYKKIGDYIELVDERNKDLAITKLLGLSISKEFITSVANTIGTDMANYKIIRKGQFACSIMQVRRDRKMPIALLRDFDEAIISQAYPVFQVKDERELLPEYLMMWFSRSEFDRHACFLAVGGVRGSLEWDDFLEMEFPVPLPDKQREIVNEYKTVLNRIKLNEQLNQKLEETAQTIYREWFMEGIDLENLPKGWKVGYLSELCSYSKKRMAINKITLETYISTENMLQNRSGITSASGLPTANSVTYFEIGNILISNIRPYLKKIWLANYNGGCSNDVLCFVPNPDIPSLYLYQILEKDNFFEYVMAGSKGTKMPRGDKKWNMYYETIIPGGELLAKFSITSKKLQNQTQLRKQENLKLTELKELLLSRLASQII